MILKWGLIKLQIFELNLFGIILLIVSILCLGLAYYAYNKRHEKVYHYVLLFSILCFIDFFLQSFESLFNVFQIELYCGQLCAIGFIFIPVVWSLLCYTFTHDGKDLKRVYKILLLIIPVFCLFGALTNPWTGLYYTSITNVPNLITYQLAYNSNWISHLNNFYEFFLLTMVVLMLFKEVLFGKKIYKKNIVMLLIASFISFFINLLGYTDLNIKIPLGITAYLFLIIILGMDMLFYNSLNILPIVNKNVINDIDIGVSFFDKNNKLLSVNPASSMLNISAKDLKTNVNTIFKDNEELLDFYYDEDNSNNFELAIENKWISVTKKNIIKYDEYLGKELTIEDITSKKIELNQKDILIKEVHHRVKSNLQIILSLLNIDLHYHPEDPMTVLNDTRVRLNYMSNLHEYIYKQSEFTKVNIREYLPQVAESLFKMYDNDITVHENLKDTVISIDLAIPLGLILTEVINNTIQYGFPNGESGNFTLESWEDNGECVVIMQDDGIGLPDDLDINNSETLGLTIIKSLTQELEGTFEMVSDNGTKITLIFPIK